MNYDDDELERMRMRRQKRRESEDSRSLRRGETGSSSRGSRQAGHTTGGRQTGGRSSNSRASGNHSSENRGRRQEADKGAASFRSGYNGPKSGKSHGTRGGRKGRTGMDRRKKILLIVGGVFLALLLIGGSVFAYVNHKIFGQMQSLDFDEKKVENLDLSDEQLAQMKGHWMIACFGVDSRMENGKMNVGKGSNADVNMICSVDLGSGEIKLVSVFRDTYLNISNKNSYNKINAAYAIGGPEQAVAALNKNLDLNITQYATFNWKAVADGINILGGVDIELSENERSWINAYITETVKETGIGSHQIEKAGLVHMDGVQAVAYGRIRYGDTDYARTERQRIVLQAAFDKAKKADWATINNVIQTVMPQLATNIDMADLIPLARKLPNFHIGDTKGFPMARTVGTVGKHGDCVIPQTLESNVVELHQFLFGTENYKPSSKVQSYSGQIAADTGIYKPGKSVDHVPVDQCLNASSYLKAKQKRAAEKAAAEQRAKEEEKKKEAETQDAKKETETESETKDYFGNWNENNWDENDWDEEDWNEFWDGQNWTEDWGDDGIGSDAGATGPGTTGNGPAGGQGISKPENSVKPGNNTKPGNGSQETTGPGGTGNTGGPGGAPQGSQETTSGAGTQNPGNTIGQETGIRETVSPMPDQAGEDSGNAGPAGPAA